MASITEEDNFGDGWIYNYQWTYTSGTLTLVTESYSEGTNDSASFTWNYNPDGSLASASQNDTYPDGSSYSDSLAWAYNANGTPATITETYHYSDGSSGANEWNYNSDGTPAKIAETVHYSYGSSSAYVWNYSNGILNSASQSQKDTYPGGSFVNWAWTYNSNGSPASITETYDYYDGYSIAYAWNYSNGILISASQQDTGSDGSSKILAWTYNSDGSPASTTETYDNSDGSSSVYAWTYNSDGTPASTTEIEENLDGSGRAVTWNYGNGILNSVTGHVNNSDGTWTDYAWYNNADGSLQIYHWTYNSDGTLAEFSIFRENADGSSTYRNWYFNPSPDPGGVALFFSEQDYDPNGVSHHYQWNIVNDPRYPTILIMSEWEWESTGSSLASDLSMTYTTGAEYFSYPTYGHPIEPVAISNISKHDYSEDGSLLYVSNWTYNVDGSLVGFEEWLCDANGNRTVIYSWDPKNGGTLIPAPTLPPSILADLDPSIPAPADTGASSPPAVNRYYGAPYAPAHWPAPRLPRPHLRCLGRPRALRTSSKCTR